MDDFKKYFSKILKAHTCDDDLDDKVRCLGLGRAESFETFIYFYNRSVLDVSNGKTGYALLQHFVNKPG